MSQSAPLAARVQRLVVRPRLVGGGLISSLLLVAVPGPMGGLLAMGAAAAAALALWIRGRRARGTEMDLCIERLLPAEFCTGRWFEGVLRFHNGGPRAVEVRFAERPPDHWDHEGADGMVVVEPGTAVDHIVRLRPGARGLARFGAVGVRVGAPGALVDVVAVADLAQDIAVLPDGMAIRAALGRARRDLLHDRGARAVPTPGREGEFERLRDYVPGDDLRHIDWKATARASRPMVRQFQKERSQVLYILLDATRWMGAHVDGRAQFDHAVEAALAVARAAIEAGDRVGLCVFDENPRLDLHPGAGLGHWARIRDALAWEQPTGGFPRYAAAATAAAARLRRRSLLLWITDLADPQQSHELLAALRVVRGRHLNVVVSLDSDELSTLSKESRGDSRDLYAAAAATDLLDERAALCARLRREGARVVISHPADVARTAVARYAEVKARGAL